MSIRISIYVYYFDELFFNQQATESSGEQDALLVNNVGGFIACRSWAGDGIIIKLTYLIIVWGWGKITIWG
jgi:hypothetical protein